jgi:paired amphipathic helix protein Sin3a
MYSDQVPVNVKRETSEAVTSAALTPSAYTSLAFSTSTENFQPSSNDVMCDQKAIVSGLSEAGDAEIRSLRTPSLVAERLSQPPEQIPASFSQTTLMTADKPVPADPSQFSEGPSPLEPQTCNSTDRPLNVRDALYFLDTVKAQFHDQPDVYNHFLETMKEFKNNL